MNDEAQSTNENGAARAVGPESGNGKHRTQADEPYFDPTAYGNGPDDFVTNMTESAAITHHAIQIGKEVIAYTATAGHLVTVDPSSSQPNARIFYVARSRRTACRRRTVP